MKYIALISILISVAFNTAAQKAVKSKWNDSLKVKLQVINDYIKSIEKNNHLVENVTTYDFANASGGSSINYYTDSLRGNKVKYYYGGKYNYTAYYKHNQIVFSSQTNLGDTVISYYQDEKILATTWDLDKEPIKQIKIYSRGGDTTNILTIEQQYAAYYISFSHPQRHKNNLNRKVNARYWKQLINSFKVSDFEKIKNGKRKIDSGGTDVDITITTAHYTFSILNGDTDAEHYGKIVNLLQLLKNKIDEFKQRDNNL